jgi:predicted membrane-bound spermidine synthase
MSELDRLKEQLVYLRLWLGIVVVAEISLIGWLASAVESAPARLLALAIATGVLLGLGIFLLHRQIQRRIDDIGRL